MLENEFYFGKLHVLQQKVSRRMSIPQLGIKHGIPGRLRLGGKALVRNPALAAELESCLGGLEGVSGLRANLACGSLVVAYDADRLNQQRLLDEALLLAAEAGRLSPLAAAAIHNGTTFAIMGGAALAAGAPLAQQKSALAPRPGTKTRPT